MAMCTTEEGSEAHNPLSTVPKVFAESIQGQVAKATSWTDFSTIFRKNRASLKFLLLPGSPLVPLSQAEADAAREKFEVHREKENDAGQAAQPGTETEYDEPIRLQSLPDLCKILRRELGMYTYASDVSVDPKEACELVLQASSRTLAGGDSYFICSHLFSAPGHLLVTPSHEDSNSPVRIWLRASEELVSIEHESVFNVNSVEKMDERELMQVSVLHVTELDLCMHQIKRYISIESPDSEVANDIQDLLAV